MSFVGAAIDGAVTAGTSIGGAIMGKGAAKKAAAAKQNAIAGASDIVSKGNIDANQRVEEGFQDSATALSPYAALGSGSLGKLAYGLGFDVPGMDTSGMERGSLLDNFSADKFKKDPGYEFALSQGNRGIENAAASKGNVLSGSTLKALSKFNQDLANNQYGASYERYNTDRKTQYDMLLGGVGVGQTAVNTAGAFRQNASQIQSGNIMDTSLNQAGLKLQSGNVAAQGILQRNQYLQNSIQGVGGAISGFATAKNSSGQGMFG